MPGPRHPPAGAAAPTVLTSLGQLGCRAASAIRSRNGAAAPHQWTQSASGRPLRVGRPSVAARRIAGTIHAYLLAITPSTPPLPPPPSPSPPASPSPPT